MQVSVFAGEVFRRDSALKYSFIISLFILSIMTYKIMKKHQFLCFKKLKGCSGQGKMFFKNNPKILLIILRTSVNFSKNFSLTKAGSCVEVMPKVSAEFKRNPFWQPRIKYTTPPLLKKEQYAMIQFFLKRISWILFSRLLTRFLFTLRKR